MIIPALGRERSVHVPVCASMSVNRNNLLTANHVTREKYLCLLWETHLGIKLPDSSADFVPLFCLMLSSLWLGEG